MFTHDRTEPILIQIPPYEQLIFNIFLFINLYLFTFQKSSGQGCTRCPLVYWDVTLIS